MSAKDILDSAGSVGPMKGAETPHMCPACGYAFGGEVEAEPSNMDSTVTDPEEERRRFLSALQKGGY